MLSFIAKKITNKKALNASLLTGVVLLCAFLSIYPMFREGSLNRLLQNLFADHILTTQTYPAVIERKEIKSFDVFSSVEEEEARMDEQKNTMTGTLQIPAIQGQRFFTMKGGSAGTSFSPKSRIVGLTYIPELYSYADVVYGVPATEAASYDNENVRAALEAGDYPCVISEQTMDQYRLVVGEELSFKYRTYDEDAQVISFVICGIIEEKEDDSFFWHHRLGDFDQMLFIPADIFTKIAAENELGEIECTQSLMLDYRMIDCRNAQEYLSVTGRMESADPCITDNYSKILSSYREQETEISMILFTFELPIIALLALFLYMVSGRILEMETTEIAMLKSRGVSRNRIIGLYGLQSSIIAGAGCILALPVGFFLCRLAAGTNAFLTFSLKDVSAYQPTWMMLCFSLIGFLLAVLFMTLPVISLSKLTITDRKSLRLFSGSKPFWEKYFLDLLLLALSGYLLYNYYKQRDAISATIITGGGVDPVIFLDSSLFIFSCGLLFLRLTGYLVRLIHRLGKGHWKPANYIAFMQIIRNAKKQGYISVFLVMTIAMGVFNANLARTVNENTECRTEYNLGCDLKITESWKLNTVKTSESETLWSYKEPDFGKYADLKDYGVTNMTRVMRDDNVDITIDKKVEKGNTLFAIHTREFGETARLADGVNDRHWFYDLNALAEDPKGVIISSNLAAKYNLKVGDKLKYSRYTPMGGKEPYATVEGRICGIVSAFPGYESKEYPVSEDGTTEEKERFLLVANYANTVNDFSLRPYEIWMRLNAQADPERIREALKEKFPISSCVFAKEEIQKKRDSAMLQITNGMF